MSRQRTFPPLKFHGNPTTMNLNHLLLMNIKSSHYFKNQLMGMQTFHEVVDEIYYSVKHLEPWERRSQPIGNRGSRVYRGVGGGGIPSTAFCLLYKLHTLKLTQKQVIKLILHGDSPYIRGLGFLYIRFTQPPELLWAWFKNFVFEDETLVVSSDGSYKMSIGKMLCQLLFENEWFSAWLPRVPVSVMRDVRCSYSELKKYSKC